MSRCAPSLRQQKSNRHGAADTVSPKEMLLPENRNGDTFAQIPEKIFGLDLHHSSIQLHFQRGG